MKPVINFCGTLGIFLSLLAAAVEGLPRNSGDLYGPHPVLATLFLGFTVLFTVILIGVDNLQEEE